MDKPKATTLVNVKAKAKERKKTKDPASVLGCGEWDSFLKFNPLEFDSSFLKSSFYELTHEIEFSRKQLPVSAKSELHLLDLSDEILLRVVSNFNFLEYLRTRTISIRWANFDNNSALMSSLFKNTFYHCKQKFKVNDDLWSNSTEMFQDYMRDTGEFSSSSTQSESDTSSDIYSKSIDARRLSRGRPIVGSTSVGISEIHSEFEESVKNRRRSMGLPSGASKGFDANTKDRTRRHSRGFRSSSQTSLFLDTGGDVIPLAVSNEPRSDLLTVAQNSNDLLRKSTESKEEGASKGEVSSLSSLSEQSKPKEGSAESQDVSAVKSLEESVTEEVKALNQTAMSTSQDCQARQGLIDSSAKTEREENVGVLNEQEKVAVNEEAKNAIAITVTPVDESEKSAADSARSPDANDLKAERVDGKDFERESTEERLDEDKKKDEDETAKVSAAHAMAAKAALDPQAVDQSALMTSVDLLIKKMTDPVTNETDIMTVNCFVQMFPTFISLPVLLLKMIHRFFLPQPPTLKSETVSKIHDKIKNKVIGMLGSIIINYYHFMGYDEKQLLFSFKFVVDSKKESKFRDGLNNWFNFVISKKDEKVYVPIAILKGNQPPLPFAERVKLPSVDFYDMDPVDIAKRMTLLDFEIFKLLKSPEFHKEAWNKKREQAPNIRALIDRFNATTNWIAYCITTPEKIKTRVKRYRFWVRVSEELFKLQNFQTWVGVLFGLHEGSVIRLEHTKADAGDEYVKKVSDGYALLNDRNGAEYRAVLAAALLNPPGIPYIGLLLRDCIYFDTGLKADDGSGVNLKKLAAAYSVWEMIEKLQKVKYTLQVESNEKLEAELAAQPCIPPKELLEISRLREPKGSKRETIL